MITHPDFAFEPMNEWFTFEEFDQGFSDGSLVSFPTTSNNGNGLACVDPGNANLITSDIGMQESMNHDIKHVFFEENFLQEHNQPSSSLSSKQSLSIDSSDISSTQIFRTNSNSSNSVSGSKAFIFQPCSRGLSCTIPNLDSNDDAIAKAMIAVISSTSSASSSSSHSIFSQNSPKCGEGRFGAFRQFESALSSKFEVKFGNDGQQMIKKSLAMLRSIKPGQAPERKPRNLHHVISERRRREKLSESFELLRMLLPPGAKKDKTSVLINTASYLRTIASQISELKEKNRKLESYLPNSNGHTDARIGSNERVQIQILKSSCAQPQVQQINLRITIVQECDIVELVLRVLECLKLFKIICLVSVDVYTFNPQMNLHAKASIKLRMKDSDWDEPLFRQAIEKAIDDVTSNTCTRSMCSVPSHPR